MLFKGNLLNFPENLKGEGHTTPALFLFSSRTDTDFLAAHEGELGLKDEEAMPGHDMASEKRKSVIAGLRR